MPKPTYDPKIMHEFLEQSGVKEEVAKMTPETLAWYKDLLVEQGVYIRFVAERQTAEVKQLFSRKDKK